MARWYDEVRLSRHSIDEIGAAFYIREILGNQCRINYWDLKDSWGAEADRILENLRRSGMLRISGEKKMMELSIVAPGDAKRSRCKEIQRKKRMSTKKGNRT